jgi:hypothetical protein
MSSVPDRTPALAKPLIVLIAGYRRWISPGLPPTCRFYPSCSAYAVEALREHGLLMGTALAVWRLVRCAPWHPGGVDFVPLGRQHRRAEPVDERNTCASEERAKC